MTKTEGKTASAAANDILHSNLLGTLSTELFERYQRSERALVATLGVSTGKVNAITEELCGLPSRRHRSQRSTSGWTRA